MGAVASSTIGRLYIPLGMMYIAEPAMVERDPRIPGLPLLQPQAVKLVGTLKGHSKGIARIAWSPDGRMVAGPEFDGTVRLWNATSGECLQVLRGHTSPVRCTVFNHNSSVLASIESDNTIRLWNTGTGEPIRKIKAGTASIHCILAHPTRNILISADVAGTVSFWQIAAGSLLGSFYGSRDQVHGIACNPDFSVIAIASGTEIRLWAMDGVEPKSVKAIHAHAAPLTGIAFAPTGRVFASGSQDCTVRLWDSSGALLSVLEGHTSVVNNLVFLSDDRVLASKGRDGVRVWDVATGACVGVLPGSGSSSAGVAAHRGEPLLATVGVLPGVHDAASRRDDEAIQIWSLVVEELLRCPVEQIVHTSAKIVVVGESNVGKSYLAHRIDKGRPPRDGEVKTTHGMTCWPLDLEKLHPGVKLPPRNRRDVVLWDMGGQEEYRLIHQLFLHDTTVALVLIDPSRGLTAFKDAGIWSRYLEKQLRGRSAVKLLVGTKQDHFNNVVDRAVLEQVRREQGFLAYYETSALNGRGLTALCQALYDAIDWDSLGKTSRPELFQRIRDEIEARRKDNDVVLHVEDLRHALFEQPCPSDDAWAVDAVTAQLAAQGVIALSRVSSGEPVLVLQVQEIERYGGSLITAARNNPRGVPALEIKAIAVPEFELPGIPRDQRLPRSDERQVLECTVQLMLEHGICFEHQGLLIFPSLFPSLTQAADARSPHVVSLYYNFSGALDNIYASLITWLVMARDFGRVRIWPGRAEFEVKGGGLCGVCKVVQPGGFAHLDVYFDKTTPRAKRELFVSFVEEHLRQYGVEINEHVSVVCRNPECGEHIPEGAVRRRMSRSTSINCPVCDTRNEISEGVAAARERNPRLMETTWALKTHIEEERRKITERATRYMTRTSQTNSKTEMIRILHLSDLHFRTGAAVEARLQRLVDDLRHEDGWGGKAIEQIDYLVISGDFTDRGSSEGHDLALTFVSRLVEEFDSLTAERCIFVPGNHDVRDLDEAYAWKTSVVGLKEGNYVRQGDIFLVRNEDRYPERLRSFSDNFYHKFTQQPYPMNAASQGMATPFWEDGIQFLTFNSAWQIDQFHRKRAGVHEEAVAVASKFAQKQERDARAAGKLASNAPLLRIAVWHHAVTGPEQMRNTDFLSNLQKVGVRLALHGDVHEMRRDLIGHWDEKRSLHVIGAGSFGAPASDRPESTPRLYNLLEIRRDLTGGRVHTRCQPRSEGAWKGWNEWPRAEGGDGGVPYYEFRW